MCLGIPMKVIQIVEHGKTAIAELSGVKREISTLLLMDQPKLDDWVLVHVGYALQTLDTKSAAEILYVLRETGILNA